MTKKSKLLLTLFGRFILDADRGGDETAPLSLQAQVAYRLADLFA